MLHEPVLPGGSPPFIGRDSERVGEQGPRRHGERAGAPFLLQCFTIFYLTPSFVLVWQIVLDELKRLLAAEAKEQTHSIKYFGGQRRKTVTKTCANLTRAEAGSMIVTAAQRHVDRKHQRVSRFNMFLVAADIDEKHSGCWQAIRTLSFALLFLVVLALQQQPWASVQVTRGLREVRYFPSLGLLSSPLTAHRSPSLPPHRLLRAGWRQH